MTIVPQLNFCLTDLNNQQSDIHQTFTTHPSLPVHHSQAFTNQNFIIPSQNFIPYNYQQIAQSMPQSSLPIAHTSNCLTMSNLPTSFSSTTNNAFTSSTSTKPILHKSKNLHKSKKRSVAKFDDECLMTNHLIEDQL